MWNAYPEVPYESEGVLSMKFFDRLTQVIPAFFLVGYQHFFVRFNIFVLGPSDHHLVDYLLFYHLVWEQLVLREYFELLKFPIF